jgi:hypothetical protein
MYQVVGIDSTTVILQVAVDPPFLAVAVIMFAISQFNA